MRIQKMITLLKSYASMFLWFSLGVALAMLVG